MVLFDTRYIEYNSNILYEEFWKEPLIKVAVKYGISNTLLRKHCVELKVPIPSSGYWTKVKFGKDVSIPLLPEYGGPNIVKKKYQNDEKKGDFQRNI